MAEEIRKKDENSEEIRKNDENIIYEGMTNYER